EFYRRVPGDPDAGARPAGADLRPGLVARPVAWRAVAASPADVLLAVLGALPGDADVAVVRRDPGQWVVGVAPDARMEAAGADAGAPGLAAFTSSLDRAGFEAGVRAIIDLVRAGECYQVNLTRRLTSDGPADPRALFGALVRHHPAPHAALLRFGAVAVVSASPERFLRRRDDAVETRPIQGPAGRRAGRVRSGKDRAENVMITDLARHDLGRVCLPGSVAVPSLCAPEAHPGLWHLVSTVTGRLRPGLGTGPLVRATFPPASVTGAPKPRVLQATEDLEPV